ncbi:MAG: twin-arginine translocation signal domain-containing protein, partial [Paracoccaceae bacterium]
MVCSNAEGRVARGTLKSEETSMQRRDVLKTMTLAAGAAVVATEVLTPAAAEAQVATGMPPGNAL